jgi:lipopolysaccharide transport system ATP-binding protein
MKNTAIKIENLSKEYYLGEVGTGTLSHDLNRWWARVRGREDPYSRVGAVNDNANNKPDYIWALKDINLEIQEGDIFGIIGKNGAGKSTLLKIISRITAPTTGTVKAKGRIASLLEVGTGMHPELTGRENIYLNGAILGMKQHEIQTRFDDIVDFSGCNLFVDTPIKRYSTGMRVRLGFAVAAFLNAEILIVDEVLAVGDEEFQKRAMGKMDEITKSGRRTLLFVSHNLAAVRRLCKKGILLVDGKVKIHSIVEEIIDEYKGKALLNVNTIINHDILENSKIDGFWITHIGISNKNNSNTICSGEDIVITIKYHAERQFLQPAFVVSIKDELDQEIIRLSNMPISGFPIRELFDNGVIMLEINQLPLVKGRYFIDVGFAHQKVAWYFKLENVIQLFVEGKDVYKSGLELDRNRGVIWVKHEWSHGRIY